MNILENRLACKRYGQNYVYGKIFKLCLQSRNYDVNFKTGGILCRVLYINDRMSLNVMFDMVTHFE